MAQLTFHGAARQVTGSQFLLTLANGCKLLIDCGLDLENRHGSAPLFPAPPETIDFALLTHAHIDHSGLLPLLVKNGFSGVIYCTYATYQLTRLLLLDAARINEKKFGDKRRKPPTYYSVRDVEACMDYFEPVNFQEEVEFLKHHASVVFYEAGHLLGAAHIVIEFQEDDETKSIAFSGDLGRVNYPLLPDPALLPKVNYLVMETTYGSRLHLDTGDPASKIHHFIQSSCVDIPGRLIIPSFSVGRTQSLLYLLNQLYVRGEIPPIPIFTDSPLAKSSTAVYEEFVPFLNEEAQQFHSAHGSLFDPDQLIYIPQIDSAEEISNYQDSCIIITSSGMITGGKSVDHVYLNLANAYCTFLFIGYCAKGTIGRKLLDGLKQIRIGDEQIPVHARIETTDVLSGHGDYNELISFCEHQHTSKLNGVFLVHGEEDAMNRFADMLHYRGINQVKIPSRGESIDLKTISYDHQETRTHSA